ncbi:MAG: two-component regulator propeller domain-containing protein, partial [Polaromonas sp.]
MRQVNQIHYGDNGDLWLATESGVDLFRGSPAGWNVWAYPFPDNRNSVNGLAEARDGTIWLATGGGVEQVRLTL